MSVKRLDLSKSCWLELYDYAGAEPSLCYTECATDHWSSDSDIDIELPREKAEAVIAFLRETYPDQGMTGTPTAEGRYWCEIDLGMGDGSTGHMVLTWTAVDCDDGVTRTGWYEAGDDGLSEWRVLRYWRLPGETYTPTRCKHDTDGDGNCHLCARNPGGCLERSKS